MATPSETINKAVDQAEKINKVSAQGREAKEGVQEVGDYLKSAVEKSVKNQPMATLAIASAIGFVLGALWKS